MRGGIVLALLPILVLPTPVGIANAIGPTLVGFVFGGPSPDFILLVGVVVSVALAWLVVATALGAWLDVALAADVARDEDLGIGVQFEGVSVARALAVRLLAHLPTAVVLAWASVLIVATTYAELTSPGDAAVPIALRVVLRVPLAVGLLTLTWLVGEAVGGVALRRLALGGSIGRGLAIGVASVLRPSGLATWVTGIVVAFSSVVPVLIVAAIAWDRARILLLGHADAVEAVLAVVLFLATWLAGMVVVAVGVAFRQVAWTVEVARGSGDGGGTMGPSSS